MTFLQRADWVGATARRCAIETVHGPHEWEPWLWAIAYRSDREQIVELAIRLANGAGPMAALPTLTRLVDAMDNAAWGQGDNDGDK